eukprot:scaffold1446_cov391-Prasinococcus_capsulatus_cf.AAC.22
MSATACTSGLFPTCRHPRTARGSGWTTAAPQRVARTCCEAVPRPGGRTGSHALGRRAALLLKQSLALAQLDVYRAASRARTAQAHEAGCGVSASSSQVARAGSSSTAQTTRGPCGVRYLDTYAEVGGDRFPLAVWLPHTAASSPGPVTPVEDVYEYNISIRKLFRHVARRERPVHHPRVLSHSLLTGWPFATLSRTMVKWDVPAWFDRTYRFPSNVPVAKLQDWEQARQELGPGVEFPLLAIAHGFLGTKLDFVDLAERLASRGFVVVAPEFADGLSAASAGSVPSKGRVDRFSASLRTVREQLPIAGSRIGLLGHSAGSGTVQQIEGRFPRVLLSGYLLATNANARNYVGDAGIEAAAKATKDPYLLVVSEGDSVLKFGGGVPTIRKGLTRNTRRFDSMSDATAASVANQQAAVSAEAP